MLAAGKIHRSTSVFNVISNQFNSHCVCVYVYNMLMIPHQDNQDGQRMAVCCVCVWKRKENMLCDKLKLMINLFLIIWPKRDTHTNKSMCQSTISLFVRCIVGVAKNVM